MQNGLNDARGNDTSHLRQEFPKYAAENTRQDIISPPFPSAKDEGGMSHEWIRTKLVPFDKRAILESAEYASTIYHLCITQVAFQRT